MPRASAGVDDMISLEKRAALLGAAIAACLLAAGCDSRPEDVAGVRDTGSALPAGGENLVAGMVIHALTGEPVAGAEVLVSGAADVETETDEAGVYRAENMPVVIFVTAYDQYALNAFDVQAIDYLLKPFDQDRFEKSFRRALKQIELRKGSTDVYQKLIDEIKKDKKYLERILVNIGPRYFFVKTVDILYISAEEKYVRLHTEKETHLVRETMNHMEQQLDPSRFTRIHRSTIINTDFIREFQPWSHGDYIAILKNGQKLTISRRYRGRLFSRS